MNLKAIFGFFVLFAVYHASEIVGNNPIFIISCFILFFIAAQFVAKLLGEQGISAFGLKRKNSFSHLIIGYLAGFLFYGGSMIVSILSGKIYFTGTFSFSQIIIALLEFMFVTFLSSASEDILTRGYVFKYLPRQFPPSALIGISSVIYVLNHIWRIGEGYTQWIILLLMGITFAIPLAVSRSLWFTIGCHWGWNTLSLFKSQISNFSDLNISDHTTDWTYIFTMLVFLLFVAIISKLHCLLERDMFNKREPH